MITTTTTTTTLNGKTNVTSALRHSQIKDCTESRVHTARMTTMTTMTDHEIMDIALAEFQHFAAKKFKAGIQEHNPFGDKGLDRMAMIQKIKACQEEVIDLWFYLKALEIHERKREA